MAGTSYLDIYRCTTLPPKLWRVTHAGSQSWEGGFAGDLLAADDTRGIYSRASLKQALGEHFNWKDRRARSCLLSAFVDKNDAINWAEQRAERHDIGSDSSSDSSSDDDSEDGSDDGRNDLYISEIDTAKLPANTYVFDANFLKAELDINSRLSTNEYIFLHRIPYQSITSTQRLPPVRPQRVAGDPPIEAPVTTPESIPSLERATLMVSRMYYHPEEILHPDDPRNNRFFDREVTIREYLRDAREGRHYTWSTNTRRVREEEDSS